MTDTDMLNNAEARNTKLERDLEKERAVSMELVDALRGLFLAVTNDGGPPRSGQRANQNWRLNQSSPKRINLTSPAQKV